MPVQYKDFKVGDVLNIDSTKGIYHACNVVVENHRTATNHPYVVRTSQNNGLRGYIEADDFTLNPGNTISFAQDTAQMFYQSEPYFTGNKVKVMSIKGHEMTENIAMFLITCLSKAFCMFGWGQSYDTSILRDVVISLPVTPSGTPDWDYMQEYISELEQERISELEQERVSELEKYLAATGLDDYELTDDDREVLSLSGFRRDEGPDSAAAAGLRKEMREFRMGDLFTSENGDVDLQQKDVNGKGIALVSSGEANAGIIGLTDVLAKIIPENTITVDMFGSVHYRDFSYKMVTHARVFALIPKFDMCREIGEFLTSAVKKCTTHFSYNNMCSWNKTCGMVLRLPICTDAANNPVIDPAKTYHPEGYIPDWDFMSRYIRAIEKMVVKDVVDYKNEFIARTKAVVL